MPCLLHLPLLLLLLLQGKGASEGASEGDGLQEDLRLLLATITVSGMQYPKVDEVFCLMIYDVSPVRFLLCRLVLMHFEIHRD